MIILFYFRMAPAGTTRQSLRHHRYFLRIWCTHQSIRDFITTAILHPNQTLASTAVHSNAQQVLQDFLDSVTDWRWLHTTGSTHTTDLITLSSLKKAQLAPNSQTDRIVRKSTRSLPHPKGWPQPTPPKATEHTFLWHSIDMATVKNFGHA